MHATLHTPDEAARWLQRARAPARCTPTAARWARATASSPGPAPRPTAARYVAAALAQGAAACLVERRGRRGLRLRRRRASPRYAGLKAATGPIAAAYYDDPSTQLRRAGRHRHQRQDLDRVVAGAGAVDARSADRLRRDRHAGHRRAAATLELHRPDDARPGDAAARAARTSPTAASRACAIEASSIGIAERRLDGTRIAVAVFTNFTQDHLDYHGSMDAYWQAKARAVPLARPARRGGQRRRRAGRRAGRRPARPASARSTSGPCRPRRAGAAARASDIGYDAQGLQFSRGRAGRAGAASADAADRRVQRRQPARRARRAARARAVARRGGGGLRAARQRAGPHGARERGRASRWWWSTTRTRPTRSTRRSPALRPLAQQRGGAALVRVRLRRRPRRRPSGRMMARGRRAAGRPRGRDQRQPAQREARARSSARSCWALGARRGRAGRARPRARRSPRRWPQAAPDDVVLLAGKGHEAYQEIAGERIAVLRPRACASMRLTRGARHDAMQPQRP